jgi:quercetin dioxygenase-like cupin family protein
VIKTIAVAAIVAAALLVPSLAGAKDAKKGGPSSIIVTPSDLKWTDAPGAAPGVQIAAVSGDPSKGPAHFFVKLPSGYSAPLHHHTPDHYTVVVSGTMVFNVDGQDYTLPAGSYFQFMAKKTHTTKCTDAAGCTLFVDARGKWDVVPEKTAAK